MKYYKKFKNIFKFFLCL